MSDDFILEARNRLSDATDRRNPELADQMMERAKVLATLAVAQKLGELAEAIKGLDIG